MQPALYPSPLLTRLRLKPSLDFPSDLTRARHFSSLMNRTVSKREREVRNEHILHRFGTGGARDVSRARDVSSAKRPAGVSRGEAPTEMARSVEDERIKVKQSTR
jgi:hypothetical protein